MNKKIQEQVLKDVWLTKDLLNKAKKIVPKEIERTKKAISRTIKLKNKEQKNDLLVSYSEGFEKGEKQQEADFRKMIEELKKIIENNKWVMGVSQREFMNEEINKILTKLGDNHSQQVGSGISNPRSSRKAFVGTSKGCGKVISLGILNNKETQNDNIYCDGESGFCPYYPACKKKTGIDICAKCGYFRVAHNDDTFWDKKNVCKEFQEVGK